MAQDHASGERRRQLYLSEAIGTALLVLGGLSVVIFMFGTGSPMERLLPNVVLRRVITGFLFGCVVALHYKFMPVGNLQKTGETL